MHLELSVPYNLSVKNFFQIAFWETQSAYPCQVLMRFERVTLIASLYGRSNACRNYFQLSLNILGGSEKYTVSL